jgi:hypothetical protein
MVPGSSLAGKGKAAHFWGECPPASGVMKKPEGQGFQAEVSLR